MAKKRRGGVPRQFDQPTSERQEPSAQPNGRLLTIADVQERCGVKERTVRTWIFEKRLPYVKLGRYVRISEGDLDEFIMRNRIDPAE